MPPPATGLQCPREQKEFNRALHGHNVELFNMAKRLRHEAVEFAMGAGMTGTTIKVGSKPTAEQYNTIRCDKCPTLTRRAE